MVDDRGLIQFRNDILDDVALAAEVNNELTQTSFVEVFADYLAEIGILNDFVYAQYRRPSKVGRRNASVDGYSENIFEETISLVLSDYSGEEAITNLTKTEANRILNEGKAFVSESINGNLRLEIDKSNPAYYLSSELLFLGVKKKEIRKVKLFLLTDKKLSSSAKSFPSEIVDDVSIDYSVWTIDRLFENIQDEAEERDILFTEYGGEPIPCLSLDVGDYPSYMCAMPGTLLANLYEKLDTELLEGNIRSFLSTRVAVNKGIRRTIVNEPSMFFVYNNGISATASGVHIETHEGQQLLAGITDFQIVNGGQTTASLFNSRYKDKANLETIFVPMKLTVVEKEKAKAVIPLIAEYANTQNRVSAADFFSNHAFCVKMERYSRTCRVAPKNGEQFDTYWFFERAKGQYTQAQIGKTKREINEFKLRYPKSQTFTKTDLAKFRNSWSGMPDTVSKGAQTNFQKFADKIKDDYEKNEATYNEKYFKETVALGIVFHAVEKIVSSQDWYQQGYRAQIVTYSIALFAELFQKQYPNYSVDLIKIWNNQEMPDVMAKEFVALTKIVNEILNDPNRGTVNVTQWCKREACWKNMKKVCTYRIEQSILDCCIDKEEDLAETKAAKKDSKQIDGMMATKEVIEYGADNWNRVKQFVDQKKMSLTPDQVSAFQIMSKFPNKIPNDYQAQLLLKIREDALDEGFKLKE